MADRKIRLTCTDCGQVNQLPEARAAAGPKCATCGHALNDGRVAALDMKTLDKAVKADDLPLLVDFWAPWCGPCRAMAPEFERLARALAPQVRLAKIDTQSNPDAASRHGIRGIPAFILFQHGRELARFSGARPAADLERMVRGHLAPA